MRRVMLFALLLVSLGSLAEPSADHGRYLLQIAGCNDCRTAGYLMAPDEVPESTWLLGDSLGWNGPWGHHLCQ